MKKILLFIAGAITGVVLTIMVSYFLVNSSNNDVTMFDKPGDRIDANQFEIFQVTEPGVALAMADGGFIVCIVNNEGKYYYDGEVIKVLAGKYAKQVGVYKYSTQMGYKTVPIIRIDE